jgi:hypothetical protein
MVQGEMLGSGLGQISVLRPEWRPLIVEFVKTHPQLIVQEPADPARANRSHTNSSQVIEPVSGLGRF